MNLLFSYKYYIKYTYLFFITLLYIVKFKIFFVFSMSSKRELRKASKKKETEGNLDRGVTETILPKCWT